MSSKNYANFDWLLPATIQNAEKLGILDEIKKLIPEENGEYDTIWFDEAIESLVFDGTDFTGKISDRNLDVFLVNLCDDDEYSFDFDEDTYYYFSFRFDDLFTPTPLCNELTKIGMEACSWVSWG